MISNTIIRAEFQSFTIHPIWFGLFQIWVYSGIRKENTKKLHYLVIYFQHFQFGVASAAYATLSVFGQKWLSCVNI